MQNRILHDNLLNAFLKHVKYTPEKTAIIFENNVITYKQLNQKINQIANQLLSTKQSLFANSKKPMIGVMFHNKLQALFCIFAILKLGAVFVPLNSHDPVLRRKLIIEKAKIKIVLTDEDFNQEIAETDSHFYKIFNDEFPPDIQSNEIFLESYPSNDDLGYVLFTSGSTAKNPKGVMQTRGNLYHIIMNYTRDLNITKNDRLLNLANIAHDQAIVDIFSALLSGSTIHLFNTDDLCVFKLHEFIKINKITIYSSIPSLFQIIFENIQDRNTFPDLRIVTIGGEETKISHAKLYQKTCPDSCSLVNGYGATEMSWIMFYYINHHTDLTHLKSIPLGFLADNARAELIKIEGEENQYELCINSKHLSSGYLDDTQANSYAFYIKNDKRYYCTGDIVSLSENHCYYFQGRKVWHEKISGKRVNTHEVEHILQDIGFGENCVVMASGSDENRQLYAFYTQDLTKNNKDLIFSKMKELLPAHMIPKMIFLNTMPTLPNGKIDRQILITYIPTLPDLNTKRKLQPYVDKLSKEVERFWFEVLDIPININDQATFKQLGGNSQLAIQLTNKVNQYFQKKYSIPSIVSAADLNELDIFTFFQFYLRLRFNYHKIRNESLQDYCYIMPCVKKDRVKQSFGGNLLPSTTHQYINFDYSGLNILVNYFTNLYNIKIVIGGSANSVLDFFKNIMKNPHEISQIGFIFFPGGTNYHAMPAVLCNDKINKKLILLVSDSRPGRTGLSFTKKICDKFLKIICQNFPQIEMRFDFSGRQSDVISCYTDALQYLVDCLRINMLDHIIPLENEKHMAYSCQLEEPFTNCKRFISPAETFKGASTIPDEINDCEKLIHDTQGRSLREFISDHMSMVTFDVGKTFCTNEHACNTYLWKRSFEFEKIINEVLEKNIILNMYQFNIEHLNDECQIVYTYMYVYKKYIDTLHTMDELHKLISLYVNLPIDKIKSLTLNDNIIMSPHSISRFAHRRIINVSFLTSLEKQNLIKSEEHLHREFMLMYKKLYASQPNFFAQQINSSSLDIFTRSHELKDIFYLELTNEKWSFISNVLLELKWIDKNGMLIIMNPHLIAALKHASEIFFDLIKSDKTGQNTQEIDTPKNAYTA